MNKKVIVLAIAAVSVIILKQGISAGGAGIKGQLTGTLTGTINGDGSL